MRSAAHAPCWLRPPGNALRYIGVDTFLSAKSADSAGALSKAGNGKAALNDWLSVVICLIARSEPIERAMQAVFTQKHVDLQQLTKLLRSRQAGAAGARDRHVPLVHWGFCAPFAPT